MGQMKPICFRPFRLSVPHSLHHAPFPHSRSSNRACGFLAHGSPTGFSHQHTMALSGIGRDSENITIFAGK